MKFEKIEKYFITFFVYAVIGWIYELFIFYYHGEGWVNRGFLYGPYLPVYGFGALLLIVLLSKILERKKNSVIIWIRDIIIILCLVFVITTVVEYISHYILDTFFNIKLWDYSKQFLNINGRVCFNASRNFAIGGTLLLFTIQHWIKKFLDRCSSKKLNIYFYVLLFVMGCDFIITIITKYL